MHPIPASKVKPTRAAKVKPPIGDIRDPDSLYRHMQRYLAWLAERQYSEQTVRHSEVWLRWFIEWCDERGLGRPHDITKPILERYQRYLFLYRKEDGQPLAVGTQYGGLARVRAYFRWLARQNYILFNPASDLDLPRLGQRLPKYILTVAEVETVMAQPDLDDPLGIRKRPTAPHRILLSLAANSRALLQRETPPWRTTPTSWPTGPTTTVAGKAAA